MLADLYSHLQVLLSIQGDIAVTREDVAADTTCAHLAAGRSELVGLALWLISQRCKVYQQNCSGLAHSCNQLHTAGTCSLQSVIYQALPRECNCQSACVSVQNWYNAGSVITMARLCTVFTLHHKLSCALELRGAVRTAARLTSPARSSSTSASAESRVGQHPSAARS